MGINNNYTAEVGIKFNDAKLQSQLKTLSEKKININAQLSGGTSTQINSINKALLKMKQTTAQSVEDFNKLDKTANVSLRNISSGASKTTTSLKSASKATKTLGQDFVSTLGKVAKFGAVTAILGAFTGAIAGASQTVKDFADAETNFMKVSDLSGESLNEYSNQLGELGENVARTRTEMLELATIAKQAGFSDSDSQQLASVAAMYQNIADSVVDSDTAMNFIVSQMKAYNLTADQSITILDQLNEVDILAFLFRNKWVIKDNYIG